MFSKAEMQLGTPTAPGVQQMLYEASSQGMPPLPDIPPSQPTTTSAEGVRTIDHTEGAARPTAVESGRASASSKLMHEAFVAALGESVSPAFLDATSYRPLELRGVHPLPSLLRVYLYKMTSPTAERQIGAYRIQITLPGQRRQRGRFDWSNGAFVLLAGYECDLDVFAFWDASLYEGSDGIPFSRNCQVLDSTLYTAMTEGIAEQSRRLRSSSVDESVVTCCSEQLGSGILRRWERTSDRLENAPWGKL